MSQYEIIGTPAMRVFKRCVMLVSVYSVSQTTLSKVEREWVVNTIVPLFLQRLLIQSRCQPAF